MPNVPRPSSFPLHHQSGQRQRFAARQLELRGSAGGCAHAGARLQLRARMRTQGHGHSLDPLSDNFRLGVDLILLAPLLYHHVHQLVRLLLRVVAVAEAAPHPLLHAKLE